MLAKQLLVVTALAAAGVAPSAFAQPAGAGPAAGFYGGVALRQAGSESAGINLDHLTSIWGRFTSPVASDTGQRALVFGGYRWANDLALEGSFSTAERYALQPFDATTPRGVGLSLASAPNLGGQTWNADVYTTWALRKSVSLYGRFGYAQADSVPAYALASLAPSDVRRLREGVNYGIGVRYDVTPALGLRLEYARFSRFAGETVTGSLPESDQVQLGMQFRF